ncbi:MAG: DUF3108 domain-containing protein [Bacteroidota bacterium]
MTRKDLIAAAFLGAITPAMHAQDPSAVNPVFQDGEWLQYKVKFGFFRLGTMRFHVRRVDDDPNGERYRIDLRLDSNPALFFINLHDSHYNIVHPESLYSEEYGRSWVANGDSIQTTRRYDRKRHTCSIEDYNRTRNRILLSLVLQEVSPYFEGPSLWLFARSKAQERGVYSVRSIMDTSVCVTSLRYGRAISLLDIGAFEDRIRARQVIGVAHWVGNSFGGMSGEFRGWFSDDDAAVPLIAHLKLSVGKVVVELEKWRRLGWEPPTQQKTVWR